MKIMKWIIICVIFICTPLSIKGDIIVQLNVNRPFNDVNEKFVSFIVNPEDLYTALDGTNRKYLTKMASMLGESFIKFSGDYYFTSDEAPKFRNPSKIIWKGFNRWTKAMNWTMVIPVPYKSMTWDPVLALKILNTSHAIGISDCVWQLGNELDSSTASHYVNDLKTFHIMVESFAPYANNWKIVGSDVSAGSNIDETRLYIQTSKDINNAFGWIDSINTNSVNENDPALKLLLTNRLPVWYILPQKKARKIKTRNSEISDYDSVADTLQWAQTMGEAASKGFDVIFKPLSLSELEKPSFSFFVTAIFKKVMGSRVFPARPLNIFSKSNKIYTHCANTMSGGLSFMVVNPNNNPMQISLRSMTKISTTEIWKYTLTCQNGNAMLNDRKLTLNSTLSPHIHTSNTNLLRTPGKSVTFWVLPNLNLEHCQYTEIEASDVEVDENSKNDINMKYSSSDKLLQKLIQENSIANNLISRAINRRRRYTTFADRPKRFILESLSENAHQLLKLLRTLLFEERSSKKRDIETSESGQNILKWIRNLMENLNIDDLPILKRNRRNLVNYFGPLFATRDVKKAGKIKKITEIKKPEKKIKSTFEMKDFNEDEFFKKLDDNDDRRFARLPEGDIHLKHITNREGEDIDDYFEDKKSQIKISTNIDKIIVTDPVSEMKPIRLLPTEYYEAIPITTTESIQKRFNIFGKKNSLSLLKTFDVPKKINLNEDYFSEFDGMQSEKYFSAGDFLRKPKELKKCFSKKQKDDIDITFSSNSQTQKNNERFQFFDESSERKKKTLSEFPWYNLESIRQKRSVQLDIPEEAWMVNDIQKNEIISPKHDFEIKYEWKEQKNSGKTSNYVDNSTNNSTNTIIQSVKSKVSSFISTFRRHISSLCNIFKNI